MIVAWLRLVAVVVLLLGCPANGGSKNLSGSGSGVGGNGASSGSGASNGDDGGVVVLDGGDQQDVMQSAVGHLHGTVFAPEGTIPISGALVYLSSTKPAPIPNHLFCDKCVQLSSNDYVLTEANGTFVLPVFSTGKQFLIVQKGQFRRVREIDVHAGDQNAPTEFTTLPSRSDEASGDHIPRMAVIIGQWDAIEVSLAKLGLGKVVSGAWGTLKVEDASFDQYAGHWPPDPNDPLDPGKLLHDWNTISQYNIVFIPCSGSDGTDCNDYTSGEPKVQENLRNFVKAGGKLYVTDYSYDYLRQPFPGFIDWEDETNEIGSACQDGSYDAPAQVEDQGLHDWLQAIGISNFELKQSWTTIDSLHTASSFDADGKPADITPKVWVTALKTSGPHPATVSFQYGCGRGLFSTYHTEASDSNGASELLPQEKALLYVLLEVSVCVEPPSVR